MKTTDGADERAPVVLSDPKAIRALAHPARMAVIEEIYSGRDLTATECAEIAGLSPSAMSYHLRSLEKSGIVERTGADGDARERRYRAAGAYLKVAAGSGTGALAASAALSESMLARTLEEFNHWMADRGSESAQWRASGGASSGQVWLLPDEAERVQAALQAELEPYRDRRAGDRPEGSRRVRVALLVFPADERKDQDASS